MLKRCEDPGLRMPLQWPPFADLPQAMPKVESA